MFLFLKGFQPQNVLIWSYFLRNIVTFYSFYKITLYFTNILILLLSTSDYITKYDFDGVQVILLYVCKFLNEIQIIVILIFF